MVNTLKELLDKLKVWFEKDIPSARIDEKDSKGRKWILKALDYSDPLTLEKLKEFTDRSNLNSEFKERFKEKDPQSRKGISALKVEISALYSFNKCFVQRYKGRMHYYRDDLSQKGKRNMRTVSQAFTLFSEFKKNLD